MHELAGSVVMVTGASRGIGEALARAFAQSGCHVVLAARSQARIEELAAELEAEHGVTALALATDVTDTAQVNRLMQAAAERLGGIDVVINNAGLGSYNPLETVEDAEMAYLFNVNVMGPVRVLRAALPHLRRRGGGTIVNVGSIVSYMALPQYHLSGASPTYCATKFALRAYSASARAELHADNINVILAVVGLTRTAFFRSAFRADADARREPGAQGQAQTELQRLAVPPDKVAARVVKAVLRGEREAYVSWWDYLTVRLAVLAPDFFGLLTRACFGLLGRPRSVRSRRRPFWAGVHPREYLPVAGFLILLRWGLRRLFRGARPARAKTRSAR